MATSKDILTHYSKTFPHINDIAAAKEVFWSNTQRLTLDKALQSINIDPSSEKDAAQRLERFRPYIARVFPETQPSGGIIESELVDASHLQEKLQHYYAQPLLGRLMVKLDCRLPISGSIKARGGIYEVLKYAETLALTHGLLSEGDDYAVFDSDAFRTFFKDYAIVVGSTGNLGLSIGIMGAALGLKTSVHMSADARQWKKDLLRSKGVNVVEYEADYSHAVSQGRAEADSDPNCHFVDDESSQDLFFGYSVAARRLKAQLAEQGVLVDADHPLFVYLPCGVGGGPGGVAFGLKLAFGDHVHCFFAEPTHAPAVLVGMGTGLHDEISAQDIGLDGLTAADGLAVSRASGMVCRVMTPLLDGIFTVEDEELFKLLVMAADAEDIQLEPSAAAGFPGIERVQRDEEYLNANNLGDKMSQSTHIVWATGGSMVPAAEWQAYYQRGLGEFPKRVVKQNPTPKRKIQ